ncbi:MAG: glycosyltransferase family 39 protein [Candidatus Auribacterota bacterium]|jgi:4-amino-4-deoxy-L-arabinose transferase-like glycosyltransferase|nr:glycosyltransferase family 39 protein [Candidatus Auribacterota bacterium]
MKNIFKSRYQVALYVLLLVAGGLYLFNLGGKGLWSAQEARNGLAARNIINGAFIDWIMPEIALERSTQKPVLFYWLVAVSCMIGKSISAFYVRLPAALSGLACALYMFYLGKRLFGLNIGLLAAIILSSCGKFLSLSRTSRIDIFLALCVVVILGECLLLYIDKKRYHLVLAYVMAAFAVLAKGPVGVVIPLAALLAFCIALRRIRDIRMFVSIPAVVAFFVLVIPYYVIANIATDGEFLYDFIIKHNIERFIGLDGTFGSRKPIWYYLPNFFVGAMPWSLFIPILFGYFGLTIGKDCWFKISKRGVTPHGRNGCDDAAYTYIAICFAVIFLFFSFSSFKRGDYILPLYPFFALLLACCLSDESYLLKYIRWFRWVLYALMGVMGALLIFVLISSAVDLPDWLFSQDIIRKYFNNNDRITLEAIWTYSRRYTFILAALIIASIGFVWYSIIRSTERVNKIIVVITTLILAFYGYYFVSIEPEIDRFCTLEPFAGQVNLSVGGHELVMFHFWDHGLAFYLDRHIKSIYFFDELEKYAASNDKIYFVAEPKWFERIPEYLRDECAILLRTPDYHRKDLLLCVHPAK